MPPVIIDGSSGITTPMYGGAIASNTVTPVTSFKNRIINGNMTIDQRNAGASVTPTNGAVTYTLDRWAFYVNQASKLTTQQSSVAPTGFTNSILVTSSSSYSVGSGDVFVLFQPIEGFNTADLGFGTANAKTITVSFWVRSSLTGNFGGSISNSGNTKSYPFTFAISSANTWEQKSVTIAGDTGGTWVGATNGLGLNLKISLGAGSTFSGTAGAWASADLTQPTGSVSLVGTNGATFYITGVQLEVGSTATSFDYRPYGTELQLCQRYYYKTFNQATAPANAVDYQTGIGVPIATAYVTGAIRNITVFPQPMRTTPTVTFFSSTLGTPTLGSWSYYSGSAWTSTTSTGVSESSQLYVSAEITKAASFTQGFSYLVNGFLTASAEL